MEELTLLHRRLLKTRGHGIKLMSQYGKFVATRA